MICHVVAYTLTMPKSGPERRQVRGYVFRFIHVPAFFSFASQPRRVDVIGDAVPLSATIKTLGVTLDSVSLGYIPTGYNKRLKNLFESQVGNSSHQVGFN